MCRATMAMSRSARITVLLIIDILFFFIELISGELVSHSQPPEFP